MIYEIPFFLVLSSILFLFMYISSIKDCRKKRIAILKKNKDIRSWNSVDGVVRDVAYGIDYQFPYFKDHLASDSTIKESDFEFYRADQDIFDAALAKENHGILIEYEFVVDGDVMVSRSISPIYDHGNINILWKVKPGDTVRVYVNPSNYSECYLKNSSREAIDKMAEDAESESTKYIIYSLISLSLSLVFFV